VSAAAPERLPHEYPFRLVERVEEGARDRHAVVLATAGGTLAGAEGWPVTLVAEALAQAILLVVRPKKTDALRLVGLKNVFLYQQLTPGDRLEIEVEELGVFGELRRYACRAHLAGALAAVAEVTVSGS
jgi:3-hydroxymyristoyl/3-hydroxydecanoyl-(acyl carrier protein) dehydratase